MVTARLPFIYLALYVLLSLIALEGLQLRDDTEEYSSRPGKPVKAEWPTLWRGQKAADTYLFAGSRQTTLDNLRFQKCAFINLHVLIVLRQAGLPLSVHHKEELYHFPPLASFFPNRN